MMHDLFLFIFYALHRNKYWRLSEPIIDKESALNMSNIYLLCMLTSTEQTHSKVQQEHKTHLEIHYKDVSSV